MSGLPWECQKASRKGLMKTIALDLLVPTLTLFGAVRFAMEVDSLLVVVSVPLAFAFWFLACLVINICEIEADARMEDLYDFRKQMDMLPGVETSYQSCFGLVSRPWWPFLDVNRLDVYLRGPYPWTRKECIIACHYGLYRHRDDCHIGSVAVARASSPHLCGTQCHEGPCVGK